VIVATMIATRLAFEEVCRPLGLGSGSCVSISIFGHFRSIGCVKCNTNDSHSPDHWCFGVCAHHFTPFRLSTRKSPLGAGLDPSDAQYQSGKARSRKSLIPDDPHVMAGLTVVVRFDRRRGPANHVNHANPGRLTSIHPDEWVSTHRLRLRRRWKAPTHPSLSSPVSRCGMRREAVGFRFGFPDVHRSRLSIFVACLSLGGVALASLSKPFIRPSSILQPSSTPTLP
jgi:hypothetical protein